MNIPAPKVDLWNGHAAVLATCEPCCLYAGRLTELGGGESCRFVYRGPVIKPTAPVYRRVLDYLGGAVQTATETVEDPEMTLSSAELSLHEPFRDLEETSR
jgi:hypothetical protein